MKTKKLTLIYKLTQTAVIPPAAEIVERKDEWLHDIQKTVEAEWKPAMVKVTYELVNYEIERIRKFFNGPVVDYYAYQNEHQTEGEITPAMKKRYREDILDQALGYDVELIKKTVRRRKSTSDFATTQKWTDMLQFIQENLFDQAAYEFPDSEHFWELAKQYGYERAKSIAIGQLQERMLKST